MKYLHQIIKKYAIKIGIFAIIILGGILSVIVGKNYWMTDSIQSDTVAGSLVLPRLNLDPKASKLTQETHQDFLTLEVAQFNDIPLFQQVIESSVDREEPMQLSGDLPRYYYSPTLQSLSNRSYVQKKRLVAQEELDAFEWYDQNGEMYLYYAHYPYTGWYATLFDGWVHVQDGKLSELKMTNHDVYKWVKDTRFILELLTVPRKEEVYFVANPTYIEMVSPEVYPQILYKAENQLIFTNPPGSNDALLLTTTADFVDMPMEVVAQANTLQGKFIKVQLGYDDLGWIRKDSSYTDYVRTYYSEQVLLDTIESVLIEGISSIEADVGASFINVETMSQVNVNDHMFFPASTQKIYILGELYRQYEAGMLYPEDTMVLTDADKVPGAGVIQGYASGSVFTLNELVELVTVYSDNTAANLLIDAIGGGEIVNPKVQQIGLTMTQIYGKYYQSYAGGFTTSPSDAARYFAYMYKGKLNGEDWDTGLINKLRYNTHNFLRNYIPSTTDSWNKSGLGETEQNDVAMFVTPYGEYALAIYTAYPTYYNAISDQVGLLSLRVHDAYNAVRADLWQTVDVDALDE